MQIKGYLLDELLLMSDCNDVDIRIKHWTIVFKQLILLDRVDMYMISQNGLDVTFSINLFTYYLKFDEDDFISYIREKSIDKLLD